MKVIKQLVALCFFWMIAVGMTAQAQFRVDVVGVGQTQYPIVIAPFKGESDAPQKPSRIISDDLTRSGQFRIPSTISVPANTNESTTPNFTELAKTNVSGLVIGSVTQRTDGKYDVRARLWDVVHAKDLGGQSYVVSASDLRIASHKLADFIYQSITGDRGVFATRIAYITKSNGVYHLWIADADGEDAQSALQSKEPIISPAWAPNGNELAYVSFESLKPVVYIHDLSTGKRRLIADFKGSNSAPAWSPNGKSLVVTLSRDGGSQLFSIDVKIGKTTHLLKSSAIDTEPFFAPGGQLLYFVSDRGGSPQIYGLMLADNSIKRITFSGDYNVSPAISPDGKWMTYITREKGDYRVCVMDLSSGVASIITDTSDDEHPRFAPNGKLIIYSTRVNGREVLMTTTLNGSIKAKLSSKTGAIREPSWSPFQN